MTDLATSSRTAVQDGQDLLDLALEQLRARRAALVDRASRATRWQRLSQSRLDLAVHDAVDEDLAELYRLDPVRCFGAVPRR